MFSGGRDWRLTLNKGEAQNAPRHSIFFHRTGRIRDHAPQTQGHRASALNLVASVIVLWNTTYFEAARDPTDYSGTRMAFNEPPSIRPDST